MFCDKCGEKIEDESAKFCRNCGASLSNYVKEEKPKPLPVMKRDKTKILNFIKSRNFLIIILICIIVILSALFVNEMFMKDLDPRQGFELISNENNVSLYHNSKDNVYMEVKEADNPNTSYSKDDVAGKKANVTCWFKKYTITCYKPIEKSSSTPSIQERYPYANPEAVVTLATMEAAYYVNKVEPYQLYLNGMLRDNNLKAIDKGVVDLYS